MRDGLVEQRKPVAGRAFGGAGDQRQRVARDFDVFLFGDGGQQADQFGGLDAAQIEALAARQDRHRHFADFGGGEDELHMRRRLFQRLEERVEGLLRQHVHFVDDVDLVARRRRRIAHALDDLADVVDAGVRGRVHLLHIDMAGFGDGDARARRRRRDGWSAPCALAVRADAVEGARDDARGRGLADAAHAGEHEGMRDAPRGEGVGQRLDQRILADQAGEIGRAVFARQHAIGRTFQVARGRRGIKTQGWFVAHRTAIGMPHEYSNRCGQGKRFVKVCPRRYPRCGGLGRSKSMGPARCVGDRASSAANPGGQPVGRVIPAGAFSAVFVRRERAAASWAAVTSERAANAQTAGATPPNAPARAGGPGSGKIQQTTIWEKSEPLKLVDAQGSGGPMQSVSAKSERLAKGRQLRATPDRGRERGVAREGRSLWQAAGWRRMLRRRIAIQIDVRGPSGPPCKVSFT